MRLLLFIASALWLSGNLIFVQSTSAQDDAAKNTTTDDKETAITVSVGKTKIKVPLPGNLVPSKSELKTLAKFVSTNAPGNQLHEIFAAKGTTEKTFLEKQMKRNADIQTVKSLQNKMTQEIFDGVQDVLAKQMDSLMKEAANNIGKGGQAFKTIDKKESGPFVQEDQQFAYLHFSVVNGKDGPIERATAVSICFVKGNMVMLNVHTSLESDKDVEWVKSTAKNWLKAVLDANKSDGKEAPADH